MATFIQQGLGYARIRVGAGLEAVVVEVRTDRGHRTIANIYNRPGQEIRIFEDIFTTRSSAIVGDFNGWSTRWGSSQTNTMGRQIEELLNFS